MVSVPMPLRYWMSTSRALTAQVHTIVRTTIAPYYLSQAVKRGVRRQNGASWLGVRHEIDVESLQWTRGGLYHTGSHMEVDARGMQTPVSQEELDPAEIPPASRRCVANA